jgi:hypothetical protein
MSDLEEDYGFEYSDEELAEEDVDIENQYYNSKGAPAAPPRRARSRRPPSGPHSRPAPPPLPRRPAGER